MNNISEQQSALKILQALRDNKKELNDYGIKPRQIRDSNILLHLVQAGSLSNNTKRRKRNACDKLHTMPLVY